MIQAQFLPPTSIPDLNPQRVIPGESDSDREARIARESRDLKSVTISREDQQQQAAVEKFLATDDPADLPAVFNGHKEFDFKINEVRSGLNQLEALQNEIDKMLLEARTLDGISQPVVESKVARQNPDYLAETDNLLPPVVKKAKMTMMHRWKAEDSADSLNTLMAPLYTFIEV